MGKKAIPALAWFIPLAPLALAFAIYFGELQNSSFLFLNQLARSLPDTLWAWLTFLGNGWGVFAIAFPLLLLAPRALSAAVFAGVLSALTSPLLKNYFALPRPAGVLTEGSFYRLGEPLLHNAFPSGHTITAFATATALYFSCDKDKRKPALLLFFIAALVGLSRSAVGAHWVTDVLGGAGFGMWCGMLGALLASRVPEKYLSPQGICLRIVAIGGIAAIYAHLTQIMDHQLNQPLQYASVVILLITLVLFIKAQFNKSPTRSE
ncbi:phosphatase PAP2 family protein [Polynucleobacter sp. MWH-Berg-3C6]|uniref:phosphatase PAP2 family protein n=1 Tax=Polynucleobacter sp. MWH-Berg-3C6 TaxID=1855882 RepID=UPI001C0C7EE2|nr:phosphatase PAP2 family protein [Polynucleobacter sp. MWH-Berg-3C6]MBU3550184.1 phosphatase PAP2 family protein [Polynucleobacter sp. MWH-Berg-3C6]